MSLALSPKALFQQQEDVSSAFRGIAHGNVFHQALSAALAEYCNAYSPTEAQICGAREFVDVLLNLSEKDKGKKRLPPGKPLNYETPEPAKTS